MTRCGCGPVFLNDVKEADMQDRKFAGIFPYLVSPVDEDGAVREKVLRELVDHLIDSGVHGLVPLGSTGEFFYLDWEQRKRIVEIVLDEAAGRVPVIPGVASGAVNDAVHQVEYYNSLHVDGILSVLNVYFPLNQNGIYNYFKAVAEASESPVVLYNNPKFTGFEIENETLLRLSELPMVQYYKDASANTGRLFELSNKLQGRMGIFSASAHVPVFVMMMGGSGWMAGPACVIPKQSVALYELCRDKKWDEAMALQRKLWGINSIFQKYGLAACIKGALTLQGFDVGEPVAPTKRLTPEGWEEIGKVLNEMKEIEEALENGAC